MLGADGFNVPDVVCDIYFGGARPCLGGLLALDGRTGGELWRHNSPHEIFSVNCNEDLNGDNLADCIIAGRVGVGSKLTMSSSLDLNVILISYFVSFNIQIADKLDISRHIRLNRCFETIFCQM